MVWNMYSTSVKRGGLFSFRMDNFQENDKRDSSNKMVRCEYSEEGDKTVPKSGIILLKDISKKETFPSLRKPCNVQSFWKQIWHIRLKHLQFIKKRLCTWDWKIFVCIQSNYQTKQRGDLKIQSVHKKKKWNRNLTLENEELLVRLQCYPGQVAGSPRWWWGWQWTTRSSRCTGQPAGATRGTPTRLSRTRCRNWGQGRLHLNSKL